jgi:endoribonuclease LACTB2
VLLDTGDGEPAYIPFLETALRQPTPTSRAPLQKHVNPLVSDILISHKHHDHHRSLPTVLTLIHKLSEGDKIFDELHPYVPPRIHKFPTPSAVRAHQSFASEAEGPSFDSTLEIISRLPADYFEHQENSPLPLIHTLHDGQTIHTLSPTPTLLTVLHTPGHTADSVCLTMVDDSAIFTADTILGEGTAVFEDLGAYMQSLRTLEYTAHALLRPTPSGAPGNVVIYPGHGPVVSDGEKTIKTYIAHRSEREAQILALIPYTNTSLFDGPQPGTLQIEGKSVKSIVRTLYAAYPPAIWPAAERGVWLHLIKLEQDGKVQSVRVPVEAKIEVGKGDDEVWVRRKQDISTEGISVSRHIL